MSCWGIGAAMTAKVPPLEKLILIAMGDGGGGEPEVYYAKMDWLCTVTYSPQHEVEDAIKRLVDQGIIVPTLDPWDDPAYRFNMKHPAFDREVRDVR